MISLRQSRHHQNRTVLQVEALEPRYLLNAPAPGSQLVPAPTQQRAPAKMTLMLAALALLLGGVGQVKAEFIVTFSQVGANVEAEGSGTLDLSALSLVSPAATGSPRMDPSGGLLEIGSSDPSFIVVGYSGVGATAYPGGILNSDPTSFGPGNGANNPVTPSTSTGSDVGIDGQAGYLYVPQAYASSSSLSSSATWDNTTISGLGLTPGTYNWTWGSAAAGTADSFVVNIPSPTTAAPEPSTLTLLGIGVVCSLGYGWRRRQQSA